MSANDVLLSPLEGNNPFGEMNRPGWMQRLKNFLGMQYSIRYRDSGYRTIFILAILLAVLFTNPNNLLDRSEMVITPEVNTPINPPILNIMMQMEFERGFKLVFYPNTTLSYHVAKYLDKNLSYIQILNNETAFQKEIDELSDDSLLFKFSSDPKNVNFTYYQARHFYYHISIINAINSLSYGLVNGSSVTFSYKYAGFSHTKLKATSFYKYIAAFYYMYGIVLIGTRFVQFVNHFNKESINFLLVINGLGEKCLYLGHFVVHSTECMIILLCTTISCCFSDTSTNQTDVLLYMLFVCIVSLSFGAFCCFLGSYFNSEKSFGGFTLLYTIFSFVGIFNAYNVSKVICGKVLTIILSFLCPFSLFGSFVGLLEYSQLMGKPLSVSNFGYSQIVSYKELFIICILQFIFYFILYTIFYFCAERVKGIPPISWSKMFNLKMWKRAFSEYKPKYSDFNKIYFDSVTKSYQDENKIVALDNLSLTINRGDICVFIGANGSGKTTLINSLTGAHEIDNGSISIDSENIRNDFSSIHDILGVTFQSNVFIDQLTVREHFVLFGSLFTIDNERIRVDMERICRILDLDESLEQKSSELSGGQKRKLSLAIAVLRNAPLIVLDEPTCGIDPKSRKDIWDFIGSLKGSTILVTTHALEESESILPRIIVVRKGKVSFSGSPSELRKAFKCGYRLTIISQQPNLELIMNDFRSIIPEISPDPNNNQCIVIPSDFRIADILELIAAKKTEYNLEEYTLHLENLEHTLLKIAVDDEEVEIH